MLRDVGESVEAGAPNRPRTEVHPSGQNIDQARMDIESSRHYHRAEISSRRSRGGAKDRRKDDTERL